MSYVWTTALTWQPEGKLKVGRQKTTRRKTVEMDREKTKNEQLDKGKDSSQRQETNGGSAAGLYVPPGMKRLYVTA